MSSTTQRRSRHSTDTVPEFHAEAPQETVSEGLPHGPYVAARAEVECTHVRMHICTYVCMCCMSVTNHTPIYTINLLF